MKHFFRKALTLVLSIALFFGCTNTEATLATDTTATADTASPATTTDQGRGSQHPMDSDTDMSTETTEDKTVSANNKLGRELNIVALMQQNGNLSTFLELVKAADMVVTLQSPATYTVFAPTNSAFANLPSGIIETLKDPGNKTELTRIIQAHVLPNKITAAEMQNNMPMKTAMGEEVMVKKSGNSITVGDARIITPDVQASNGVVHVVNKLLVPPQ